MCGGQLAARCGRSLAAAAVVAAVVIMAAVDAAAVAVTVLMRLMVAVFVVVAVAAVVGCNDACWVAVVARESWTVGGGVCACARGP